MHKRKGTREPLRRGAICFCGLSRQPQARSAHQTVDEVRPTFLPSSSTVVTVLWRCLQFLDKFDTPVTPARCRVFFDKVDDVPVVLCNGVPQVQSVSLSVAYERLATSMTHRIACPRAVHATALPYFTRLPVSCLSQQTREQARAVTEFSVLLAVFYHFRFFTGVWQFSNFLGSAFPSAFAGESGTFHIQRVQVDFLFPLKVLRVQFLAKF